MRVLHIYKTYRHQGFGGVEQLMSELCHATTDLGVSNTIATIGRRREVLHHPEASIHTFPAELTLASNPFSLGMYRALPALMRNADVIHCQFPWPTADAMLGLLRPSQPVVVTYNSDIVRQRLLLKLYRPLMRRFFDRARVLVATSSNYVRTSQELQPYRHKVRVIPIGLSPQRYPASAPDRLAHWRSRVGEGFFLFVGVMRYYKGLHILLDACAGTQIPVLIVGAGPTEKELQRQAKRLGLAHVRFLGQLPEEDKIALLELCRAVVFPSHLRAEAFGVSLLEGAMFGKPLISAEIGTGSSFVNLHGQTGIVVPPSDPAALREAMLSLLADPEWAASMGRAARERYLRHFQAREMGEAYLQLYRESLEPACAKPLTEPGAVPGSEPAAPSYAGSRSDAG
ncbi:MAG: glycosyltransferase [Burkholderiales bacterium]